MWYELINWSLDWTKSPSVAQFILMRFPSVGQNKSGRLVTCSDDSILWKLLFKSFFQDVG